MKKKLNVHCVTAINLVIDGMKPSPNPLYNIINETNAIDYFLKKNNGKLNILGVGDNYSDIKTIKNLEKKIKIYIKKNNLYNKYPNLKINFDNVYIHRFNGE